MGNLLNSLKKFVSNKNTVTILGVLAGVIVLWFFYNYRVNQATSPRKVPYAKVELNATDQITDDKIGYIEVNSKFLKTADICLSPAEVINKYIKTGASIPVGGLFYKVQVVERSELPNTLFEDMKDGYTPFSLSVDNHSTFGNSIYPGDKIDLYLKATDDADQIIFGKFIESITVLGVRDSSGNDVFKLGGTAAPAELIFAVENDMYELLKKTDYLSGVSLVPVPRNKNYTETGGEVATVEYLKNFILSKTATLPS